jgi:hypothetical protein
MKTKEWKDSEDVQELQYRELIALVVYVSPLNTFYATWNISFSEK